MPRQASDFRAGVEAAAKWLEASHSRELAAAMVRSVADDPEGTEARTVAQIVRYMRETAFGMSDGTGVRAIERMANDIEHYDWKRS